jgi:hypothetical protein
VRQQTESKVNQFVLHSFHEQLELAQRLRPAAGFRGYFRIRHLHAISDFCHYNESEQGKDLVRTKKQNPPTFRPAGHENSVSASEGFQ